MFCNLFVVTFVFFLLLYFRYCLSNAPNVQTEGNLKVQFLSDDTLGRTGAQCTIVCIEDSPPPTTTTTITSTTTIISTAPIIPQPQECMFGYDSVCLSSKSTETRTAFCPSQVYIAVECIVL